jgi:hypothetical protein
MLSSTARNAVVSSLKLIFAVLFRELGFRAYKLELVDDLSNPFVSMYFGAAYVAWLSEYEGRYI